MIKVRNETVAKELVLRVLEGGPKHWTKNMMRLREYAFDSVENYIETLNWITKLIQSYSDSQRIVMKLIEKAPLSITESRDERLLEIVARLIVTFHDKTKDESLLSALNEFLKHFKKEKEIFVAFPQGPQGPIHFHPIDKSEEDQAVFKVLTDIRERGWYGLVLSSNSEETIFLLADEIERYFNLSFEEKLKIQREIPRLLSLAREAWWKIRNEKRWGIRSGGRDIVAIVEEDPIRRLQIKFLRFIQEVARPPGVGIEMIFENKKIFLSKLSEEGKLLIPWWEIYPEATLLLNTATILYLRDLTCGKEDTFVKLRAARKQGVKKLPSLPREPRECLVPRQIIEQIPRPNLGHYLSLSSPEERIQRISRKPIDLRYRRDYRRRLPSGWQASQAAKERAKEMGYELLAGETYVKEFIKEEIPEQKEMPGRILRDISAARELSQIIGF